MDMVRKNTTKKKLVTLSRIWEERGIYLFVITLFSSRAIVICEKTCNMINDLKEELAMVKRCFIKKEDQIVMQKECITLHQTKII